GAIPARRLVAEASWWPKLGPRETAARDRLWRYSVTLARAAIRLATQAGDPAPHELARVGLLIHLGAWILAATDPVRFADWLEMADPHPRRELEETWLGACLAVRARERAAQWGCDHALCDAQWICDDRAGDLDRLAMQPARLTILREAQ